MATFNYFPIAETLEKFRRKEISPVEVITAHLQRAQALQPKLNAFVHLDAESALARARQAEAAMQRGEPLRALTGIPLTVKSCIDVAGWPCPAGSLLRKDYVPTSAATLVARLESAGAILLGNTNTPGKLPIPGTFPDPQAARAAAKRRQLPAAVPWAG